MQRNVFVARRRTMAEPARTRHAGNTACQIIARVDTGLIEAIDTSLRYLQHTRRLEVATHGNAR